MGRGKRGRGPKRKHGAASRVDQLSKKQKKHYKDFGEVHPSEERESGREKFKKIEDIDKIQSEDESSEEEQESVSVYQQLISSIGVDKGTREEEAASSSEDESDPEEQESQQPEEGLVESGNTESEEEEEDEDQSAAEDEDEKDATDKSDETDEDQSAEAESDEDEEEEEDGTEDSMHESDPFSIHLEKEIEERLAGKLDDKEKWSREEFKLPLLGRCHHIWPKGSSKLVPNFKEKDIRKLHVKQKLCNQTPTVNTKLCDAQLHKTDQLTPLQLSLFSILNNYQDLYYPERTPKNAEEIRLVYCLHAINHVLKTRSRVIAHNNKIKSKKDDVSDEHRDQGLTRPKVLIVLPFRAAALKVVNIMSTLLMVQNQSFVTNKKRFNTEYGGEEDKKKGFKPEDFEATFDGNIDDHFRVGLGVAKKSFKLYTEFYSSDIILASPLGLRTVIGAEGEEKRDFDFLSSIEVLIFDQMDVFMMQNWDHILHLMSHIHLQPKEAHGVDFSRVRMWSLNGWSKFYRQTLMFSSMTSPEMNAVFNKHCQNYAGKFLVPKLHAGGAISQIVTQLPQVFQKVDATSYSDLPNARFEFFKTKVLPELKDTVMSRTMIFIPSYFDFVRLRNYFKKEEMDFVQLSEYSKNSSLSRARTFFFHGKTHFMLYTERLHFYRRFKIRGIKHLVFYDLPVYGHFYSELCNMLQDPQKKTEADNLTCTVLYSKYDAQKLAAVVGMDRAGHMVSSTKNVHMFVTGDT